MQDPRGHGMKWPEHIVGVEPPCISPRRCLRPLDMHIFGDKQADLNWENEELRQAIYKIAIWWLERGIDGFRVSLVAFILDN